MEFPSLKTKKILLLSQKHFSYISGNGNFYPQA